MYCSKKGEARRLSTGQSKKPWISFWCRSIVMTCVRPDLHIIFASSLLTMQPRFLILPVQNTSFTHTHTNRVSYRHGAGSVHTDADGYESSNPLTVTHDILVASEESECQKQYDSPLSGRSRALLLVFWVLL